MKEQEERKLSGHEAGLVGKEGEHVSQK